MGAIFKEQHLRPKIGEKGLNER